MRKNKCDLILENLFELFPDAKCELNYENLYQLVCAVMLSAQTTDVAVNKITVDLFTKYPTVNDLAKADIVDIENCIKRLGLYRNKAQSLKKFANQVLIEFNGIIPDTMEGLTCLAGVGRKTANVILSEYFNINRIAVDTHVERISKRLGFAKKEDTVLEVEKKLMKQIDESLWTKTHHTFIFFGRYLCKARNPLCNQCNVKDYCKESKTIKNRVI